MKIVLVTGADGFIGKHLCLALSKLGYEVIKIDRDSFDDLESIITLPDFIVHLAGVNRPKDEVEYQENVYLAQKIIDELKKANKKCPIIYSSTRKVNEDTAYAKSKLEAERLFEEYAKSNNSSAFIYRLDNVYGPLAKPNYNSVIATFCYNIARGLPLSIDDPKKELTLTYVEDVANEFIRCIEEENKEAEVKHLEVKEKDHVQLGEVVELIYQFKDCRKTLYIPDLSKDFIRKLNATYISYLDASDLSYNLKVNEDTRGAFVELFRLQNSGQVSINIIKKDQKKGGHWHFSKFEKFAVIKGSVLINLRKIDDGKMTTYNLDGETIEIIDIPPLTIHEIINVGEEDAYIIMWASEVYDENSADTHRED